MEPRSQRPSIKVSSGKEAGEPYREWPCYYVRFHQAVPAAKDKEPVGEFYLQDPRKAANKYVVDKITYTSAGVIWEAHGEFDIIPLANVQYARLIANKEALK